MMILLNVYEKSQNSSFGVNVRMALILSKDSNSSNFCEMGIMDVFSATLDNHISYINQQIIQTISILFQNLWNEQK